MKYSLSPLASPLGFPSASGYNSLYMPPLITIQIQYAEWIVQYAVWITHCSMQCVVSPPPGLPAVWSWTSGTLSLLEGDSSTSLPQ